MDGRRGPRSPERKEKHRQAALKVWEERRAGLRPNDMWNREVAQKQRWERLRVAIAMMRAMGI